MAGLQKPYLIPAMHCKETAWAFVLIWIYVRGSLKESHVTFRQLLKGQAILLKLQHLLKYFWMFCLKKFSDSSPHCSIRWELCLRKRIGAKMCVTYFLPHLLLLTGISEYGAYCLLVCCPYWCLIKGVRSCIISIIINFGPRFLPNGGKKKKEKHWNWIVFISHKRIQQEEQKASKSRKIFASLISGEMNSDEKGNAIKGTEEGLTGLWKTREQSLNLPRCFFGFLSSGLLEERIM